MSEQIVNYTFFCKNIIKIKIIQRFFKKIIEKNKIKHIFIQKNKYIEHYLIQINQHCFRLFKDKLLNSEEYDTYMVLMENILQSYNNLITNLQDEKFKSLQKVFFQKYFKKIIEIKKSLLELCNGIGCPNIVDLISIYFETSYENSLKLLNDNNLEYIDFYNEIFIPLKSSIYTRDKNNNVVNILDNNKVKFSIGNLNDKDDFKVISSLKKNIQFFSNIDKTVSLYLSIKYYSEIIFIKIKGNIKEDNLNIYHNHPVIKKNIISLKETMSDSKNIFYENYINQLSLQELVINDNYSLKNKILEATTELKILKQKNISSMIKDFLNSDLQSQRETLTLLLLNDSDSETEYLAYLLYDILSTNDDNKSKNDGHSIFTNLHWSIQKKFKICLQKIKKKNDKLVTFNEDQISYEQRIMLMKVDDYVKHKAMEKYKEVSSKSSSDGSTKAQQYLEGILKIPFGIYRKEKIIEYLDNYSKKIEIFNNSIQELKINKNDPVFQEFIEKLKYNGRYSIQYIDLYFENYNFYYLQNNIRYNIEQINNFINNLNTKSIKNLIKLLKKKNIKSEFKLSFKITEKNKMVKIQTLKDNLNEYIQHLLKLRLTNICPEKDFHDIMSMLNIDYYYQVNPNGQNKIIFDKYLDLKNEWSNFNKDKIKFLDNVTSYLDKAVYGHDEAKTQIKRIIAQWISGENTGYSFGFEGPPGTGKTSIAKKGLTKCLTDENGKSRPFSFIAMGGSTNGSTLEGHSYTYVGSTWGRIVDILMESKCMNPIIFIDELDKISKTEHGKELIGILTHLTDSTQNQEFADKYFSGIKIDLSKVLFIFSYNNPENIDPILLDRIHRVKFKSLKKKEKIYICKNYMIPEINNIVGFEQDKIIIDDQIIEKIIDHYTYEPGVRKLRERLTEIIREINLCYLTERPILGQKITLPFRVTLDILEKNIFSQKIKMKNKIILKEPKIGLVNGLYATTTGLGGITIIEAYKINSSNFLSLELTGQQGDIMKESMKVAKTVAWNILENKTQSKIKKEAEKIGNQGIHIHCPEGATPKDGPSAGLAITTALVSLFTQIPVNNKIGMTGEIDLNGSSHEIGGLESKLYGAKKAGVEHVLIPRDNENDYILIKNDPINEGLFENFKITLVDSIWDVLDHALVNPSKKTFVNYTLNN